jgi:hypothetical protein
MVAAEGLLEGVKRTGADVAEHHAERPQRERGDTLAGGVAGRLHYE